mmetsp:Transcript_9687/g.27557  ORF Transcript_9687/g.27557 Transcript_9687/m.27557 type:complete len:201 (-) Transcript_9687:1542-2144(-)
MLAIQQWPKLCSECQACVGNLPQDEYLLLVIGKSMLHDDIQPFPQLVPSEMGLDLANETLQNAKDEQNSLHPNMCLNLQCCFSHAPQLRPCQASSDASLHQQHRSSSCVQRRSMEMRTNGCLDFHGSILTALLSFLFAPQTLLLDIGFTIVVLVFFPQLCQVRSDASLQLDDEHEQDGLLPTCVKQQLFRLFLFRIMQVR